MELCWQVSTSSWPISVKLSALQRLFKLQVDSSNMWYLSCLKLLIQQKLVWILQLVFNEIHKFKIKPPKSKSPYLVKSPGCVGLERWKSAVLESSWQFHQLIEFMIWADKGCVCHVRNDNLIQILASRTRPVAFAVESDSAGDIHLNLWCFLHQQLPSKEAAKSSVSNSPRANCWWNSLLMSYQLWLYPP